MIPPNEPPRGGPPCEKRHVETPGNFAAADTPAGFPREFPRGALLTLGWPPLPMKAIRNRLRMGAKSSYAIPRSQYPRASR